MKTSEQALRWLTVMAAFLLFILWTKAAPLDAQQPDPRPNVIVITLDDADWGMFEREFGSAGGYRYFPNISRLADEGLRFTNFHVTTPICGPSRACMLTGRYAHQVGIKVNEPEALNSRGLPGGYDAWRANGPHGATGPRWIDSHLGVWMQNAGYRTMLIGKYLHSGFIPGPGQDWINLVPPGWDDSYISLGGDYFGTTQTINGVVRRISDLLPPAYPSTYRTDVEGTDALRLIREQNQQRPDQPFFLHYNPLTPHRENTSSLDPDDISPVRGMPALRHRNWWNDMVQPIGPDFNEWDMSDKPLPLRDLRPLRMTGTTWRDNELILADNEFRRRMRSMRAVDDFVRDLRTTLEQLDLVSKTVIFFTSDNGYALGQQRMFGKGVLLDRQTRVPLFVWGPGRVVKRPEPMRYLLGNIDLAPTILDLADEVPPVPMNGRSFRPLLEGTYTGLFRDWRPEGLLLEHWQEIRNNNQDLKSTAVGVRMFDTSYVEWATGEREFYDLRTDPYQLENRSSALQPWEHEQFQNRITLHKLGMSEPNSTIESPFFPEGYAFDSATITGTAEYATDLSEVRLVIRDLQAGSPAPFWNGDGWQSQYAFVRAEMAGLDLTLSNWKYEFGPPISQRGRFAVTSRAYGRDGSFQAKPDSATLWLENSQPFGQIAQPVNHQVVRFFPSFPMVVSGWAQDDVGVRVIRLVLQDASSGQFWNGSAWQAEAATVPVVRLGPSIADRVNWSYRFQPPAISGTVNVTLRMISEDTSRAIKTVSGRFSWSN